MKYLYGIITLILCTIVTPAISKELIALNEGSLHPSIEYNDTEIISVKEGSIVVQAQGKTEWPNITFRAIDQPWDLSGYYTVKVDLTNASSEAAYLGLRLDNPYLNKEDAPQHAQGFELFDPAETRTMTLRLYAEPWAFDEAIELHGMRRAPGQSTMNLTEIDRIQVFVGHAKAPQQFIVSNIRAEGEIEQVKSADFLPFVDTYGQYKHEQWLGKVISDDDLEKARLAEEADGIANPGVADLGKFGGWTKGPKLEATGYFRVEKHADKWWFVDPEGYLFWSNGPTCISSSFGYTGVQDRENYFEGLPAKDGPLGQFYSKSNWAPHGFYKDKKPFTLFRFYEANLFRKYGADWKAQFYDTAHNRLKSWGMNTVANWADRDLYKQQRTPYVANFFIEGNVRLEASSGYWSKFHDVFDPSFRESIQKHLAERTTEANDPWCIGFFVDNELSWGNDGISLALETLTCSADQPAKKVFVAQLRDKYSDIEKLNHAWGSDYCCWQALLDSTQQPDIIRAQADLEKFYAKTADTYFKTIRDELKKAAPNHLYLGCRFAWVNDIVAHAAAHYCDVVSYNKYQYSIRNLHLPHHVDRPIIIGEYHFGATDRGHFHPGLKEGADQAARAELFKNYLKSALHNSQVVGVHWFQYVDEHIAGRADEENYNVGLVDVCDTPYQEMVDAMREIGNQLYQLRSE